jgi:hypothetical protein
MDDETRAAGSPAALARTAGALYFVVIAAGVTTLMLRQGLFVRGDGAATLANIAAHEANYRLALLAELAASIVYLGVVVLLYWLMKPASPKLSSLAAAFGGAGCAIGALALLPLALPLVALDPGAAMPASTQQAVTLLGTALYSYSYKTALIFFGLYCLSLGILTLRAAFLPRLLGLLLLISGISWLTTGIATFVSPDLARAVGMIALAGGGLGEALFTLWLLVAGVSNARWREQAGQG